MALNFTIDINAPKQRVWEVMLADETYREWTSAFHPGSCFKGSWDKGSKINFVSEDDGGQSGMAGQIAENIPYEFISIEIIGEIVDGEVNTTSEEAKQWIGGHENYRFRETDGVTTLDIELTGSEISPEMAKEFEAMWPKALEKLKEIAER